MRIPHGDAGVSGDGKSEACKIIGAWRSLEAHLLWEQGVGGSNPLAPTSNIRHSGKVSLVPFFGPALPAFRYLYLMSHCR